MLVVDKQPLANNSIVRGGCFKNICWLLTEGCKEDTYTLVRDKLFLLRRGNPDMFGQDQLQ